MSRALVISVQKAIADKENELGLYNGIRLLHEQYDQAHRDWREEQWEIEKTWRAEKVAHLLAQAIKDLDNITRTEISSVGYNRLEHNPDELRITLDVKRNDIDLSDLNTRINAHQANKPQRPDIDIPLYFNARGSVLSPGLVVQILNRQLSALKALSDTEEITIATYERINKMA